MQIANEIVKVAGSLKNGQNDVVVSAIVQRNDAYNEKGKLVNNLLRNKTREFNLGFIEHNNIQNEHLNYGGLHLNKAGWELMSSNFASYIKL